MSVKAKTPATVTGTNKGTQFNKIVKGAVISETQYYTVVDVNGSEIDLKNENGDIVTVDSLYAEKCLLTADQWLEEVKVNRTELVQIFLANPYTAMTVNYKKKVDEKDVIAELLNTYKNTSPGNVEKEFTKTVKTSLEGQERTAVGRHAGSVDEYGRIRFVDMNKDKGSNPAFDGRTIVVDPRTIAWVIVKNKKYTVK